MSFSKLIRIELKREHIWVFRIVALLASIPFIFQIYDALTTEVIIDGKYTFAKEDDDGYYSYLVNWVTFTLLLFWLGTFGSKVKKTK